MILMPLSSPGDSNAFNTTTRTHVRTAFSLTVRASYQAAFPLFGPNGERSWAGDDWNPQFVYPLPAADIPGAVFMIKHGSDKAVWVNTAFDREGRHIQYTYLISDVMVTTIDLTFEPLDSVSTKVSVVYERTALNGAVNDEVRKLATVDPKRASDWEKAINAYLKHQ